MVRALIALTKPRIIELLLVTTVPTMLLAQRGVPSIRLVLVTLVGGTLAAGSANTLNCDIDRDLDAVMKRTSRRPLAPPVSPACSPSLRCSLTSSAFTSVPSGTSRIPYTSV